MQEIRGMDPVTASYSKRLIVVACVTASAISIVLICGIVNQVYADLLKPFSLILQSERRGEFIDTSVVQNSETRQVSQNQLGAPSGEETKDGSREKPKQVSDDQDYTKWSLPENALARFGKGRIIQMRYSPDGKQLAVATPIGIWIYDAQSGEELKLLTGYTTGLQAIAYLKDGNTIAAGYTDRVGLWNTVTGKLIKTIKTGFLNTMTLSPDSDTIAIGTYNGSVELWDVATGQRGENLSGQTSVAGHTNTISSIAYSPDKTTLAAARGDKTVRLWDIATGQIKATLTGHTDQITSITYSPDGITIATTSSDDTVRLWDSFSGNPIDTLTGHQHYVLSVVYSPDGNTIASMGWEGIIFWHVDAENDAVTLKGKIPWVSNLAYSSDGTTLAVAGNDGTAYIYDTTQFNSIDKHGVKPKGKPIFSGHTRWANCVTYSPDGTIIATANFKGIHLWNAETVEHLTTLKGHTDNVYSLSFSPDGKRIAAGSWDGIGHLWNVDTGEYRRLRVEDEAQSSSVNNKGYITRQDNVTTLIFSPDGTTIASAIDEKTIRLWNTATGKLTNSFIGHTDYISSIAFSPDGNTIASVSRDQTVRLWDVKTGQLEATLTGHTDAVYSVSYSPDGETIATGAWYSDTVVRLWDVATNTEKLPFRTGSGAVLCLAYSPDGTILAISTHSEIQLWDVATRQHKKTYTGHQSSVDSFAFSPDGNTIASVSLDGTMILWDVTPKRD